MLGIIGIIVALIVFLILIYRGVSLFIAAPISVLIVALTNNLNPLNAFTQTYVGGLVSLITPMFSIIFFGVILGKVFADTGCAQSIATGMMKMFVHNKASETEKDKEKRIALALLVVFIFNGLCTMGGIDAYVLMFTTVPILIVICKEVDIPRHFIPGMIYLSAAFVAAPGAPQITNVICVAVLNGAGFNVASTGGLVVGIVGVIIIAVGGYFTLLYLILKSRKKGNKFEYGNIKAIELDTERKLPNFYLSFIPLLAVFVCYTILHLHIAIALLSGIIITLIIAGRCIVKGNQGYIKAIKNSLNVGSFGYPSALVNIITPAGLAAVITATVAFGRVVEGIAGLEISIYMLTFLSVAIIVALTASPPAALQVSLPLVISIIAAKGLDLDMGNVLRIAAFTSITFESLPWNGMIVQATQMVDTDHKHAYPTLFMQTVVFTTLAALAAVVISMIAPNIP